MDAVVFGVDRRTPHLTERSVRSLRAAGFTKILFCEGGKAEFAMPEDDRGVLLLRAGAWLRKPSQFKAPPMASKPLHAVGIVSGGGPAAEWATCFAQDGGDFSARKKLPACICEWICAQSVRGGLAQARISGSDSPVLAEGDERRVVHWSFLDAGFDERWRCLQIVTSLQHGGAEKIAWELTRALPNVGMPTRIVVLGKPLRSTLPELPEAVNLSGFDRAMRAEKLGLLAHSFGADRLHAHLIDAEDARLFSAHGIPLAMTIHNTRNAWPNGLESLEARDASLLIGCCLEVERELLALKLPIPTRTIWNGVSPDDIPELARPISTEDSPLILTCVANPRAQKRLHLLPAILAATQRELKRRGDARPLRLVLAGEVSPRSAEAVASYKQVQEASRREGVEGEVSWTQGAEPIAQVLGRTNVVVCCSAYEGLSLAHMEALAAGLPLVSTDAGGTRELAPGNPALTLLPLDASPEDFAQKIADCLTQPTPSGRAVIARDFCVDRMAARVADLLQCLNQARGETIWFITNNLSTGGAQSSLRRLSESLLKQGYAVRVALLQEALDFPTPGRLRLLETGVPVFIAPPAGTIDPDEAVKLILGEMNLAPPKVVVFWNAIPIYKILLADRLLQIPVYDVSPGEMLFASLAGYFKNPRPGLPYREAGKYGERLSGVIVKYGAEAATAKMILGVPVEVIANGVIDSPPRNARLIAGPLVFGTAARLSPQKRLEDLIEAFRLAYNSLPDCELQIAGGAEPNCEEYVARLRELGNDLPIRWLGDILDITGFHSGLDIFVMISEPSGCPNASLEAMAAGLPVIATDCGGAAEQVISGVTGLLTPARNAKTLADAMLTLARDSDLRTKLGAGASAHIGQHFSLSRMSADYVRILQLDQ